MTMNGCKATGLLLIWAAACVGAASCKPTGSRTTAQSAPNDRSGEEYRKTLSREEIIAAASMVARQNWVWRRKV